MKIKTLFIIMLFTLVITILGCGGSGNISATAPNSSSTTASVLSSPSSVAAVVGNGSATLSWKSIDGASSYNIYQGTTSGVTKTNGTKIGNCATNSYTVTRLTNETAYYFVVTAVSDAGESGESSQSVVTPSSTLPIAPSGVVAKAGNGQVIVSWSAVTGATYNIYYSTFIGVTKTTGTKVSGASSPQTIAHLNNGTTYHIIVTAANSNGEGDESSQIDVMPADPNAVSITASVANTSQGGIKIQHDIISSIILCGDTYTSNPVTAQLPMSTGSVYAEFIATPGYTLESITDNGIPRTDFWFEGWNLTPRFTIADTPIDPTQRWNAFIKNNHTIVAKFRTLYQINASVTSTTGGSITIGYNRYSINYGTHTDAVFGLPITVYVTPPSGYVVDKLLDNGVEVTGYSYPPNSNSYDPYTFQTRSDHNLQVSFRKQ
jgi:hypothetical protein